MVTRTVEPLVNGERYEVAKARLDLVEAEAERRRRRAASW
jgi:hypothetical protein